MNATRKPGRLGAIWRRLPLAHRIGVVACTGLVATVAAPWVETTPFLDGFVGSDPQGPSTLRGYDSPALPGLVPAMLGAVGALVPLIARRKLRSVLGAGTLALAAAWSIAFVITRGLWTCFLCEVERVLWGAYAAAGLATVGTVAMAWELREEARLRWKERG